MFGGFPFRALGGWWAAGTIGASAEAARSPAQVLGNAELRKRYDAKGKAGVAQDGFMEGNEFFSMLFGSEQFDGLIGELIIASAMAG